MKTFIGKIIVLNYTFLLPLLMAGNAFLLAQKNKNKQA